MGDRISEKQADTLISVVIRGLPDDEKQRLIKSLQKNWPTRVDTKKTVLDVMREADHPCTQEYIGYLIKKEELTYDILIRILIDGYTHIMDELLEKNASGNPIGVRGAEKSIYTRCQRRLEQTAKTRKNYKVYNTNAAGGVNYMRPPKANTPTMNIPHVAEVAVLTAFLDVEKHMEFLQTNNVLDAAEYAAWNTRYKAFVKELIGIVADIWDGTPPTYEQYPNSGTNLNMVWPPPPPKTSIPAIIQEDSHECTREFFRRGILGYDPKIAAAESPAERWAGAQGNTLMRTVERFRESKLMNEADTNMLEYAKILALGFTKVFENNLLFWEGQPVGVKSGDDRMNRFPACHARLAEEAAMIFMRRFELSEADAQAAVVLAQNAAEAVTLRKSAEKRADGIDEARAAEAEAIRLVNVALGVRVGGRRRHTIRKIRSKRYRRTQRSVRA
jgi:hypothetical protein